MTDNKPYRTMRLALAMRGGVSLAVWIGGAVAELDLFRRACNDIDIGPDLHGHRRIRADKYRELLEKTKRFNKVEIDILAGASAGGLNAVLFGLAQSCDTVMDDTVRRTWIKHGGIWELLRETGSGRVESILQGDGRLFKVVRDALGEIAGNLDPGTVAQERKRPLLVNGDSPTQRITVELAATLLDDPRHPNRQNRARFSFSKTSGALETTYSTIPASTDKLPDETVLVDEDRPVAAQAMWRRQMALDRMALAARATSSFPGAFEPAKIHSVHSGEALPGTSPPLPFDYSASTQVTVNMARAFLYSAGRTEPFGVVDGGVFDNIPIDRAIRAIQRASASEPSDRSLIYLDPEPPVNRGSVVAVPEKSSAASWLPVIRSSLTLKQRQESADDELSLVREYNDRVLQTRGRLEALAAIMRALRQSAGDPAAETMSFVDDLIREESYTQCRIALDAPRIASLLTEPWSELCYPPREAVDYVALPASEAVTIKNRVARAYNDTEVGWQLSTDVIAMLDWVRVLIAWVRALEDLLVAYAREGTGEDTESGVAVPAGFLDGNRRTELLQKLMCWKAALYRWLTVLGEAKHRAVDEVLARPLRAEKSRTGDRFPLIASLQESRGAQRGLTLTPELRALLHRIDGDPERLDRDLYRHLSALNQFRYPSGPNLVTDVSTGLETILGEIREQSGPVVNGLYDPAQPVPAVRPPTWLAPWAESVYPHLYLYPLSGYSIERIAKIFASTGVPDTAHMIRFDSITGDEAPQITVDELKRGARARHLGEWVRRDTSEARIGEVIKSPDRLLTADGKLAGNALSRFGGFFLWHWRENDWQWGRLDAAAGIARIVANRIDFRGDVPRGRDEQLQVAVNNEATLRRSFIEQTTKALQHEILAESAEQQRDYLVAPAQSLGDIPPFVTTVGAESLSAISPRYRFALASRAVPLVFRALWPANSSLVSVGGGLSRLGNVAIRPVAVALPLAADPLRLGMAVIIALAAAGALGASVAGPVMHCLAAGLLGLMSGLIAARVRRIGKCRRTLRRTLQSIDTQFPQLKSKTEWLSLLDTEKTGRWRAASWVLAVVCAGLAVLFTLAAIRPMPFAAVESILATWAVVLGLQHWFNQRSLRIIEPQVAVPTRKRIVLWSLTVVVGLAVVLAPLPLTSFLESTACDAPPLNVAVAGVGTALLTAVSLWGWAGDRWAVASIAATGILGAAVQGLLDDRTTGNGLCDFLPVLVWLATLAAITQRIPHRKDNYGQPPLAEPPETGAPGDPVGDEAAEGGEQNEAADDDRPLDTQLTAPSSPR
ncbi:DUF3376 domain-containing protein [Mycolicibacterium baixiangningiae]|uniref:DUF3376 domain-containing protein n=1 Tax=Mycolicibacterium baixiangningiae TaxID=2761578 RepID=UPI0018D0F2A6|nr:DUF3376 domain-containing protein [Mycolicibacterium baixiangningiae]